MFREIKLMKKSLEKNEKILKEKKHLPTLSSVNLDIFLIIHFSCFYV